MAGTDTAIGPKPTKAMTALWTLVIALVGALGGAVGGVSTRTADDTGERITRVEEQVKALEKFWGERLERIERLLTQKEK